MRLILTGISYTPNFIETNLRQLRGKPKGDAINDFLDQSRHLANYGIENHLMKIDGVQYEVGVGKCCSHFYQYVQVDIRMKKVSTKG